MANYNEMTMVESREVREQYMERTEVLDKVKHLLLLPEMECMTTQQVADYFEVPFETIRSTFKYHADEFELDGVKKYSASEIKSLIGWNSTNLKSENQRGKFVIFFENGYEVAIPNVGVNMYPKRAVLRMGMLLRDSKIAKEVRTQLLNAFETTTVEQRVDAIETEQELLNKVAAAFSSGNQSELLVAAQELDKYRKRCITTLESEKEILAGRAYEWSNRSSLTKIMRTFAGKLGIGFAVAYSMLFDELLYKHGISLKARGAKPYTQWIKDSEFPKVYQSIAAMCEKVGIDTMEVFGSAKFTQDDIDKIMQVEET